MGNSSGILRTAVPCACPDSSFTPTPKGRQKALPLRYAHTLLKSYDHALLCSVLSEMLPLLYYIQAKNRSTGTPPDGTSREDNACSPSKAPRERYCRPSKTNTSIVRHLGLTSQYSGIPAC